jgi:hypothetical protein
MHCHFFAASLEHDKPTHMLMVWKISIGFGVQHHPWRMSLNCPDIKQPSDVAFSTINHTAWRCSRCNVILVLSSYLIKILILVHKNSVYIEKQRRRSISRRWTSSHIILRNFDNDLVLTESLFACDWNTTVSAGTIWNWESDSSTNAPWRHMPSILLTISPLDFLNPRTALPYIAHTWLQHKE